MKGSPLNDIYYVVVRICARVCVYVYVCVGGTG